jgi:FtsH-binding integral membrane protein
MMNDEQSYMSDVREQLIGISVSIILIVFMAGGFALYSILFLSKAWALAAICIMLVVVPHVAVVGYSHGRKLVYGREPTNGDALTRFFGFSLFVGFCIAATTFVYYAELYRAERWGLG